MGKRYVKKVFPIAGMRWENADSIDFNDVRNDGIIVSSRRIATDTDRRTIDDEQYMVSLDAFFDIFAEAADSLWRREGNFLLPRESDIYGIYLDSPDDSGNSNLIVLKNETKDRFVVSRQGDVTVTGTYTQKRTSIDQTTFIIDDLGRINLPLQYVGIPYGDTSQRPGSPFTGAMRFNTEIANKGLEVWDGVSWWKPPGSIGGSIGPTQVAYGGTNPNEIEGSVSLTFLNGILYVGNFETSPVEVLLIARQRSAVGESSAITVQRKGDTGGLSVGDGAIIRFDIENATAEEIETNTGNIGFVWQDVTADAETAAFKVSSLNGGSINQILKIDGQQLVASNYVFDVAQALTPTENGYVLTYDSGTGKFTAQAPAGLVGAIDVNEIAVGDAPNSIAGSASLQFTVGGGIDARIVSVEENTPASALALRAESSGTVAVGFGPAISFLGGIVGGGIQPNGNISIVIDDGTATPGTAFTIRLNKAGGTGITEAFRMNSVGQLFLGSAAQSYLPEVLAEGSATNIDLKLTPKGTGNLVSGNYKFDVDQALTPTENGYVMTYDDSTGLLSLKASAGGGSSLWQQNANILSPLDSAVNGMLINAPSESAANLIQLQVAATERWRINGFGYITHIIPDANKAGKAYRLIGDGIQEVYSITGEGIVRHFYLGASASGSFWSAQGLNTANDIVQINTTPGAGIDNAFVNMKTDPANGDNLLCLNLEGTVLANYLEGYSNGGLVWTMNRFGQLDTPTVITTSKVQTVAGAAAPSLGTRSFIAQAQGSTAVYAAINASSIDTTSLLAIIGDAEGTPANFIRGRDAIGNDRFTIAIDGTYTGPISSKKLKKNIKDLKNGLDVLMELRPRMFKWKESGKDDVGFIAEEVIEKYKWGVEKFSDDNMGMKAYQFIPLLVKSIQELKELIDSK